MVATRTKQWDLPAADSDGARYSIVRQYDAGVETDGSMADSWKAAKFAGLAYYGHRDDVGTPGYRRGGPLPVLTLKFSVRFATKRQAKLLSDGSRSLS